MGKRTLIWTTLVLAILLVCTVGYIVFDVYSRYQDQNQITIYQQGAQAGYEQAIMQIAQQATTCQQVPLNVENQTINLIAVACLQAAPQ